MFVLEVTIKKLRFGSEVAVLLVRILSIKTLSRVVRAEVFVKSGSYCLVHVH